MEKEKNYKDILLHVPHSSKLFPEGSGYSYHDLNDEERLLIDYYTNELFGPEMKSAHISSMVFPYCRLYSDVERLIDDPLEKEGLGISYQRRISDMPDDVRSFSTLSSAFNLYADFHAEVAKHLTYLGDETLLIDCHSFSALPNLLNSNPPDIDICIGFNDDETCPDDGVIGDMARFFGSLGYKVGINEPFSNSKTFSVPVRYHSVMIEINKRLYMDEKSLEKNENFMGIHQMIQSLYEILLTKK